ncbi:MAG: S1 RNA-binding domain-containing protein [Myxococcales bacterium]|nr:S1 RNA-binding domain-containing protein [Myxococcales bacterium]
MTDTKASPASPVSPPRLSGAPPKEGDLVTGTIVKITGNVAFIDYGARSEGYIELGELRDEEGNLTVGEGDTVSAEVVNTRGAVQLSARRAQAVAVRERLHEAWKRGEPVEGRIVSVNKGGFEIRVDGIRAFCPLSQIGEHFPREPAREVGRTYTFKITEFGDGQSLVVSRRALLEEQKQQMREALGERVRVGERLQGKVTQIKDFGVFIDLGDGLEGMIHVSELSHGHVGHPRERVNEGDAVEVEVIRVDTERGRIALSMKALERDPWSVFVDELQVGQTLKGTVDRIQPFGAFVKLADGIDGLLHVSGITTERRIEDPAEVLTAGQEIEVVVEKIERDRKRIGLVTPEVAAERQPVAVEVKVDDVVRGPVVRVERYGVFVEIAPKVVGLVPNAEMDTERGADHQKMFPVGTEIEAVVLEVDRKRGRIRLSRKALQHVEEKKALNDFRKKEGAPKSLGSFGDLLKDFLQKNG